MMKYCTACGRHKLSPSQPVGFGRSLREVKPFPADILFVFGQPFKYEAVAGAGTGEVPRLLRLAIDRAMKLSKVQFTWYATYLVRCAPRIEADEIKDETLWACNPLFEEVRVTVKPASLVFVGKHLLRLVPKDMRKYWILDMDYVNYRGGVEAPEYRTVCRQLVDIVKGLNIENP